MSVDMHIHVEPAVALATAVTVYRVQKLMFIFARETSGLFVLAQ